MITDWTLWLEWFIKSLILIFALLGGFAYLTWYERRALARIEIRHPSGNILGVQNLSGGEGRGGQTPAQARFVLEPGSYQVLVRLSNGSIRQRALNLADSPLRLRLEN